MTALRRAFKSSLPALLCYLPLGMVYGVLCTKEGYSWYYAPLFSLFVFGGAMQFLALSLVAAESSLLTIACALFPLGIRNIFYGFSMLERYSSIHPLLRLYLAHGLVDATYSLINADQPADEKEDRHFIVALTVLNHTYWVLGALLGSFVIYLVELPKGLEFSLTAFFAAAAVEQFLVKKEMKSILISIFAIAIAAFIFPSHFFLAAIAISILACLAFAKRTKRVA
jgi:4-azaleucine resistance transporter AzlC